MATLTSKEIREGLALYEDLPYHGIHHPTLVMLDAQYLYRAAARSAVGEIVIDWEEVDGAILMHDAGYRPLNTGPETNEERSARWADAVFDERSVSYVRRVQGLILETAEHTPPLTDLEACLVCDADMAGFAKPWHEFLASNNDIEAEYLGAGVTPEQYNPGRRAFLEGVLEKALAATLFSFPVAIAERNAQAVKNVTRLLSEIP